MQKYILIFNQLDIHLTKRLYLSYKLNQNEKHCIVWPPGAGKDTGREN